MLLPCLALAALWTFLASAGPVYKRDDLHAKRYYDYDEGALGAPIRGVNIGGWLVLEPYITPSLFEAFRTNEYNDDGIPPDEYHFCQYLGEEVARSRLEAHWSSWYTEEDFANIAQQGFNMVRIPIGYWAFEKPDNEPYVKGSQEYYLDQAIGWAAKHGLKVWVDLHGARGSQNGFDNSGLRGSINFLNYEENIQTTLNVIKYLGWKYSQDQYLDTVIGVELINEPLGPAMDVDTLKDAYLTPAYNYIRNEINSNQGVVIHDAFEPYHYWDDYLTLDQGNLGVVIDHHHYQVFSPAEVSMSIDDHVKTACDWGVGIKTESHWTVAGEWSAALTDCTKWLNGVGVGARYDGSYTINGGSSYVGSCANNEDINSWSPERKTNTRRYVEAQLDAFEQRGGWVFWCYKTETSIEWDAQRLMLYGLFPQPLDDRQFPGQCSS